MLIDIILPEDLNLLINPSQLIDFDTKIYEREELVEIKIPLAQKLQLNPQKIFNHITKFVGEEVQQGELLAVKKNLFFVSKYHAEFSGVIKEINHVTGELVIQTKSNNKKNNKAFFKARVESIKNNLITIKVKDAKSVALKKVVANFGGVTFYLKKQNHVKLIQEEVFNKIVIADFLDIYLQTKLEALGCICFVTLQSLPKDSEVFHVKIINIDDFKNVLDYSFPYCLINKKDNKIYFYTD